ncbi:MFS transporter [Kitasatospora paracochleata]|uniref:EmrB/QacA subfamily drug resistance transporter n=1 Tax=Kitasatospora paracochleata TaxID=58354 RepID=A0ABT1IVM7_9ACTN|nr:MFS transporter [Kitasatospora paracochleata]MCP2308666.1 EmrB/QacA subfamily drug resistance transporter [Kitasatospora paracochleata]
MASSPALAKAPPAPARRGQHPGIALTVIAATQLMVVLDITIVNIALPHIQQALNFSTTGLSWVINAYTLTFGGLLLLGGRMGDILGRRRVFIVGVLLFSFASLLGGVATSSWWLLAARSLQGVGGAIASPTALALIATNFKEGPERNRAFGVFSAVAGAGGAIGLLAGGMLTSWLSWRWVFFVNVPIGIAIAVLAPLYINESERHPGRFDLAGAFTATLGMVSLVFGFIRASEHGWSDPLTLASFGAALALLLIFLANEQRVAQPITPLHLFRNRNRSGAYAMMLCLAAAMFSIFFFITLFVQEILGFSPLKAGFAFLPISLAIIAAAQFAARSQFRFGPKPFMVVGSILVTAGVLWSTRIDLQTTYASGVLGPTILFGLGMGSIFVPLMLIAVSRVAPHETGAATGMLNATQQVGGSLGLSILVTVYGTASRNEASSQVGKFLAQASPAEAARFKATGQLPPPYSSEVLVHGISQAFYMGLVFAAMAMVIALFVIKVRKEDLPGYEASEKAEKAEPAEEPAPAGGSPPAGEAPSTGEAAA